MTNQQQQQVTDLLAKYGCNATDPRDIGWAMKQLGIDGTTAEYEAHVERGRKSGNPSHGERTGTGSGQF